MLPRTSIYVQTILSLLIALACVPLASASESDPAKQNQVDTKTLEDFKKLRSQLASLNKDSLIAANAMVRSSSIHALPANFFGSTVIVPIPPPMGEVKAGLLPPNAGLLKVAVIDMRSRLSETTQQVSTIAIPAGTDVEVSKEWTKTLALINQAVVHYNELARLYLEPKANGLRLKQATIAMYEDTNRARQSSEFVYASLKNAYSKEQKMLLVGKKRNIY